MEFRTTCGTALTMLPTGSGESSIILRRARIWFLCLCWLLGISVLKTGFTPLLSLAHLDEETVSTFPLKIKVQGVRLPNSDAQERAVAGIAGPQDHALFLYVQKAATNCASGSRLSIHSRITVNGKDDMPGTKDCAKIASISAGAESFTISTS
jgi:hypothetical protein